MAVPAELGVAYLGPPFLPPQPGAAKTSSVPARSIGWVAFMSRDRCSLHADAPRRIQRHCLSFVFLMVTERGHARQSLRRPRAIPRKSMRLILPMQTAAKLFDRGPGSR